MPRRHRRSTEAPVRPLGGGFERRETWHGSDWAVRTIAGGAAVKSYRCPGCQQEIRTGTPHVVSWPVEGSVEDRRHWHSACWTARERRGPR